MHQIPSLGHALSTPFGALKPALLRRRERAVEGACPLNALRGTETLMALPKGGEVLLGHALSTPFGALKREVVAAFFWQRTGGACPLNALRGTETCGGVNFTCFGMMGGMPSQRPSGH